MRSTQYQGSVLALGEILWDMLPTERLLGGAPANFCYRLAQLGASARMASRIGGDSLGKEILAVLKSRNFDISLIQIDPGYPTGTVDVVLSLEGHPRFNINPHVAYDYLDATEELLDSAREAVLIYFGTLMQRSETARSTLYRLLDQAPRATKFLDINLRSNCYTRETVSESLKRADILKINATEALALSELLKLSSANPQAIAGEIIHEFNVESVLVTSGEAGVYARTASGEECSIPGIPVDVLDTIGSGDSFSAGFVFKYIQKAPLEECCLFGNLMGALTATKPGGMPPVSPDELDSFVRKHS